MSDEPQRNSHAAAWILSVIVLAPLLYLLTLPPIVIFTFRGAGPTFSPPPWLEVYAQPAQWLMDHTPLHGPMSAYMDWWQKVAKVSPP